MLTFAVQWAPFGGGDEFILPEFGITPGAFYHRLRAILFSTTSPRLGPRTTQHLLNLCATKVGPCRHHDLLPKKCPYHRDHSAFRPTGRGLHGKLVTDTVLSLRDAMGPRWRP